MASSICCSSISGELEFWSSRLHELSRKIDRVPSIDKYKMLPHIEDLHILMTEMDDRLNAVMDSCPTIGAFQEGEACEHYNLSIS